MLFNARFHERIRRGEITRTYRAWDRARVRVGGTYRLGAGGVLEVTNIRTLAASEITDRQAREAGYASRDGLLSEMRRYKDVGDDMLIYEVTFRFVVQRDRREALREDAELDDAAIAEIRRRLDRMDASSPHGAWTRKTLALIAAKPRVRAGDLASELGRERLDFKKDVRRLKALGLTISHEVGYEISPRGKAFLVADGA